MIYRLGKFLLHSSPLRLLDANNKIVEISPQSLRMLESLIKAPVQELSREELVTAGWGKRATGHYGPNNVQRAIADLRRVLPAEWIVAGVRSQADADATYRYVGPCDCVGPDNGTPPDLPTDRHFATWQAYAREVIVMHENADATLFDYARVRPCVELRYGPASSDRLLEVLVNADAGKVLVVFGEYGQGKSYISGALAHRLAIAARNGMSFDEMTGYFPVIIPLRRVRSLQDLDRMALDIIWHLYSVDMDVSTFRAAASKGRLGLILDGLDEFIARSEVKDFSYHLAQLTEARFLSNNRVVITTRPNIFESKRQYNEQCTNLISYVVEPVSESEARQYFCDLDGPGENGPMVELFEILARRTGKLLYDLISRPLYLDMIRATSDRIAGMQSLNDFTVAKLYEEYVYIWHSRERKVLGKAPPLKEIYAVLGRVAHLLLHEQSGYITKTALNKLVAEHYQGDSRAEIAAFASTFRERMVLVPEFDEDDVLFTFRHPSLQSYFTAQFLLDRLKDGSLSRLLEPRHFQQTILAFFFAMIEAAAPAKEFQDLLSATDSRTGLPGALLFLWSVRSGLGMEEKYLRACWDAQDPHVWNLLMRGLGPVVRGRENPQLSTMERPLKLRDVHLDRADLNNVVLQFCEFKNVHLNSAELENADLRSATLVDAVLDDARFNGCNLNNAQVLGGNGRNVSMAQVRAEEQRARFSNATFIGGTFESARLPNADFSGSRFVGVNFDGAQLRNVDAHDCRFEGCSMYRAILTGIKGGDFDETDLTHAVR